LNVVELSLPTAIVKPGELNAAAVPVAAAAPEQSLVVYTRTVEPASAVPEISGLLSFAGETGLEAREPGSPGAVESSTYVTEELEQPDTLPAASVAVALKVVEESFATEIVSPGEANAAAVPVAAAPPEQSLVVYTRTVEPASAVPEISGLLSFAGETGLEASAVGRLGAVVSYVNAIVEITAAFTATSVTCTRTV
jgi:hypothetical protein